jgi:hypothetical protein
MHQNLLNAEFASVEYLNAKNKKVHIIRVIKALTKVLHKCFCCIYACRKLHFFAESNGWGFSRNCIFLIK